LFRREVLSRQTTGLSGKVQFYGITSVSKSLVVQLLALAPEQRPIWGRGNIGEQEYPKRLQFATERSSTITQTIQYLTNRYVFTKSRKPFKFRQIQKTGTYKRTETSERFDKLARPGVVSLMMSGDSRRSPPAAAP